MKPRLKGPLLFFDFQILNLRGPFFKKGLNKDSTFGIMIFKKKNASEFMDVIWATGPYWGYVDIGSNQNCSVARVDGRENRAVRTDGLHESNGRLSGNHHGLHESNWWVALVERVLE